MKETKAALKASFSTTPGANGVSAKIPETTIRSASDNLIYLTAFSTPETFLSLGFFLLWFLSASRPTLLNPTDR